MSLDYSTPLAGGNFQTTAYWFKYKLNLFSNFTYFLDDPVNGDQFEQADDRNVYGWTGSWTKFGELFGAPTRNTLGFELRQDRIDPVGLYSTLRRRPVVDDARGQRRRRQRRHLRAERYAVERLVPLGPRHSLRPVPLQRRRQHCGEFGQRDRGHRVTQGVARLRTLEQDRVLRERGLRLSQQRRARRDDQGGPEERRCSRSRDAAGAQHGRGARACAPKRSRTCNRRSRCGTSSSTASSCSSATPALPRPAGRRSATASNGTRAGGRCRGSSPISTSRGTTHASPAARRRATIFPARRAPWSRPASPSIATDRGRARSSCATSDPIRCSRTTACGRIHRRCSTRRSATKSRPRRSCASTSSTSSTRRPATSPTTTTSRLPGEPPAGVADTHVHPGEKRSFRLSLSYAF